MKKALILLFLNIISFSSVSFAGNEIDHLIKGGIQEGSTVIEGGIAFVHRHDHYRTRTERLDDLISHVRQGNQEFINVATKFDEDEDEGVTP